MFEPVTFESFQYLQIFSEVPSPVQLKPAHLDIDLVDSFALPIVILFILGLGIVSVLFFVVIPRLLQRSNHQKTCVPTPPTKHLIFVLGVEKESGLEVLTFVAVQTETAWESTLLAFVAAQPKLDFVIGRRRVLWPNSPWSLVFQLTC